MINIYNSLRDENDALVPNRTILFIRKDEINENGEFDLYSYGLGVSLDGSGYSFIVDDWLIDQLDKVVFKDGTLKVKEGEELVEPVKSELEREEEELLKRLAELRAKKTADTEDTTDEPAE